MKHVEQVLYLENGVRARIKGEKVLLRRSNVNYLRHVIQTEDVF